MTGNSSAAGLAGFLTGSAVTAAAMVAYYYLVLQQHESEEEKEEKAGCRSRSIPRSTGSRSIETTESAAGAATGKRRSGRARNNLTRSAVSSASATDEVHIGLISDLVVQMWSYIDVAGCDKIRESIEPSFRSLPTPLSTLCFRKLDLGTVPIRLDNIVVHKTNTKTNTVQFDMDIFWDGVCDIELHANYVGSFGIESIKFHGRLAVVLSLEAVLPIAAAVQYSFINPPELDFEFTGLAQIAELSFIDRRIRDVVQDTLNGMLVLPKRNLFKINPACDFLDEVYQPPMGMARIGLIKGRGFQIEHRSLRAKDIRDVFCVVAMGGRSCKSATCWDNLAPVWENEVMDFLLCDYDQVISLQAWDNDSDEMFDSDDALGSAQVTVGQILLSGKRKELELFEENHKPNGSFITLGCDVLKFTSNLDSLSSAPEQGNNSYCGLLTVLVAGAFDLPVKKENVQSFVKVTFEDEKLVTGTIVDGPGIDSLNPVFDTVFHVPLRRELVKQDGQIGTVTMSLMNGPVGDDCCLGKIEVDYASLTAARDNILTETRKIGNGGASLRFRVSLCGVAATTTGVTTSSSVTESARAETPKGSPSDMPLTRGLPAATGSPVNSTGSSVEDDYDIISNVSGHNPDQPTTIAPTVRITAVKGHGFKIERKLFRRDDVPDVYCNIKFGSDPSIFRTKTIKNNLKPVWNESKDYQMISQGQVINIDVYDEDSGINDPDDYLGSARTTVGRLLLAGGSEEMELKVEGKPTGAYVTFHCELV